MQDIFNGKKVIIFDMDGTLIDSVGIWNSVDEELIGRIRTIWTEEDVDVQNQRDSALRRFASDSKPYISYCAFLGEKYGSNLSPEEIHDLRYEIAQYYLETVIDYKKDAEVLISKLKAAGYRLAIATTTRRNNMDIYRTKNINMLRKARIDNFFNPVYTREDAREIKPNPEILIRVMNELGVRPEECLMFEDSLIGVEAAKRAGIECVAVYDKYSDNDRYEIEKLADFSIYEYAEVIALL